MGNDLEFLKPFARLSEELDITDPKAVDEVVVILACRGIGEPYVYVTRGDLRKAKEYYDKYK